MKILELRFKNLNSLYGEWVIDFTDPEFVSNGIFALTGPTGAGKTTILDAVCLALYGATPRLGRITKSGNEIMSRQTGECYAEVLFESQAGRFRCHWEQRRARKKPGGKLQDQEHQIADAETSKPIEIKKSLVTGVIEEKTGMDFDRFTRSILLAQGGFDTFLKADVEQKSRILEQITGTGIYSEISRRVHERQRDEQEKLTVLQAETSGIVILDWQQEEVIQRELESSRKHATELKKKLYELIDAIKWLNSIKGLEEEICSLVDEAANLQTEIDAFEPERKLLERAMKAVSLSGKYATLKALRKQQSEDQEALKSRKAALPGLEKAAREQAASLEVAEQQTIKAKEAVEQAAPLIREIRSLDQRIAGKKEELLRLEASCKRAFGEIEGCRKSRAREKEKRIEAEKSLALVEDYLGDNHQDEWLVSGLAGVEEQVGSLLEMKQDIALKESEEERAVKALAEAARRLEDSAERCGIRRQGLEEAEELVKQGRDALSELLGGRPLREYRSEKESLLRETAYLRKIAELEEHRARLEDGKPCPLCGSKEHPFAEGNVPVPDEIERKIETLERLIARAEDLEVEIRKLEDAEAAARRELNDSEKLENNAFNDRKSAEKNLADLRNSLKKSRAGCTELKQDLSARLRPLGIAEIEEGRLSSLLDSLRSRLETWRKQVNEKAAIEKQVAAVDSELKSLDRLIETKGDALAEKQEDMKGLREELAAGADKREKLYGDRNPDKEEERLKKALEDAEEGEKKARSLNAGRQQEVGSAKTDIDSLRRRIERVAPELNIAKTEFSSALEPAGFPDEKQFLEAMLPDGEREALSSRAKELDKSQSDLNARQKDREAKLELERAKKITDESLDELESRLEEKETSQNDLLAAISVMEEKMRANEEAKERIKRQQAAIDAQRKECMRWDKLHRLIGSADGKKYRNFAQGLTFELMVSHANRRLEKMTDRYLLIRDDEQPLELNVVDNYQAGEIRSTRNLSGGESFIVSLALALGLSRMASRKVRVDSLFLDEGFGTLDEDALETALETLSGLQQDGKLIGVISHVSALRERIRTRITISPVSGGKSILSGPGCQKIGNSKG